MYDAVNSLAIPCHQANKYYGLAEQSTLPRPFSFLEFEVKTENRHPGAETEGDEGEEEQHQHHSNQPAGEGECL